MLDEATQYIGGKGSQKQEKDLETAPALNIRSPIGTPRHNYKISAVDLG